MTYINSILDTDLYKLSMGALVLQHYPDAQVKYEFINRSPSMHFNIDAFNEIKDNINALQNLSLTNDEYNFLKTNCPYLPFGYLEYLKNYRFNPDQVEIYFNNGQLKLFIKGLWRDTILFEVPLMAIISEAYFNHVDTNWKSINWWYSQERKVEEKAEYLGCMKNHFTDFGTRRRRSYNVQDLVVKTFKEYKTDADNFFGTSNVHLAHKYDLNVVGTYAHELVQGISALEGLRHANKFTLQKWSEVYKGDLGIALTDTFGTKAFFKDFDNYYAQLFTGVRQDSGDPMQFADKMIKHYKSLGINPITKLIIFSDGLDVKKCLEISQHCQYKIGCGFGIGTFLTNDFENSKPLNIVIKLREVNGIQVVKLSDSPGKEIGDVDALRVAKWTFFNQPL